MSISRRQFMIGGCSAAIAAMAGGRIGGLIFDDPTFSSVAHAQSSTDPILVTIFLRGGCDGLSFISPYNDSIYKTNRNTSYGDLSVPDPLGSDILSINNPKFFPGAETSNFCLHPRTTGIDYSLKELYDAGHLALVHACGLEDDTRSHFDAMDYIERGTPGNKHMGSGWLTRHLQSTNSSGSFPALASNTSAPISLLGSAETIAVSRPANFDIVGPWRYNHTTTSQPVDAMVSTLDQIYQGSSPVMKAGRKTIDAIRALRSITDYTTDITAYAGRFGNALKTVAQMIKLDVGLRVATVDLGGWDHHEYQGVRDGTFASLTEMLSRNLYAFYKDMAAYEQRLTIVVMSEFGRRLGMNASSGTDHGHGGMMMVLGGKVNGGKMFGSWPGLEDLDQGQDLKTTTDFRTVLSEAVVRVLGNPQLGTVFPGITPEIYSPATALNIFQGNDPSNISYDSIIQNVSLPLIAR